MGKNLNLGRDVEYEKQEKRDKLDLILELLVSTLEPVKKTHLLYRMKINHAQLSRHLSFLLELAMIAEASEPHEGYVVTEKGKIILELFGLGTTMQDTQNTRSDITIRA